MAVAIPIAAALAPEALGAMGVTAASIGLDAATTASLSTGVQLLGTGISAAGAIQQGEAQQASAKANAQIQQNNATIEQQNATNAAQEGEVNAAAEEMKTRAAVGSELAAQGANGVDVNSGSNLDTRLSESKIGQLNAVNIRANAARLAYGHETAAQNAENAAALDTAEAKQAMPAAELGAGASLLSGFGSAGMKYADYLSKNSLNNPIAWKNTAAGFEDAPYG